jgi:hypothetical protein
MALVPDLPANPGEPSPGPACWCAADELHFYGHTSESGELGILKCDLYLRPGNEFVHLDYYKRLGTASMRPHLRRMYEAMERAGLRRLTLEAGLSKGPVHWAVAGVDFSSGRSLLDHLELLAFLLSGDPDSDGTFSFHTPEDVLRGAPPGEASVRVAHGLSRTISLVPGTQDWALNSLSHMTTLGIDVDAPRSIGEAILFAISPWDGVVDMSSPGDTDGRFRAFLGL